MRLFDVTSQALESAIGAAGLRQQVISNNIANVNTPGFKRSDVRFDETLAKALDAIESERGLATQADGALDPSVRPVVETDTTTAMRADGSNVDIDREMSTLAENNVRYNALVQVIAKKHQMLEHVASDGRR